jgi:acyl carrier protein
VLDRLPLTPNGKVDRRALPDPQAAGIGAHVAPRTETEAALAAIWSELLGQPAIGVTDDFFELGGDSIVAIRLAARIRDDLKCPISLRDVFESSSVEQLARQIEARDFASSSLQISRIDALLTSLEVAAE